MCLHVESDNDHRVLGYDRRRYDVMQHGVERGTN
jgi:hypothetical protein